MRHLLLALLAALTCASASANTTVSPVSLAASSVAACTAGAASAAEAAAGSIGGFACTLAGTVDVVYTASPTKGYTQCATEGGTCALTGPSMVIFGAGLKFTAPQQFATTTPCTNAVFTDPNYGVVKSCWQKSAPMVTAWKRIANNGDAFVTSGPTQVRYGSGVTWSPILTINGPGTCNVAGMKVDPRPYLPKSCEALVTVPAVTQLPQPAMPVVNRDLIPPAAVGHPEARVRALTAAELVPGSVFHSVAADIGAFRVPCDFSHIANDDPIVFPGTPGVSHLHTFVGNTLASAASTTDSLLTTGNSTCSGGTLNRTAYWFPTIIDTSTGQPITPDSMNWYYKQGYFGVPKGSMVAFPKGLRMIAGDSKNAKPVGFPTRFSCLTTTGAWDSNLSACPAGGDLVVSVTFPQCWDGVNLDSPDHKSHMAYGVAGKGCPPDHPVALPEVSLAIHYAPETAAGTANWRLSSDMYVGPAGYSSHADWYGAWDPATEAKWLAGCVNASMDCHDNLLGNDEILY